MKEIFPNASKHKERERDMVKSFFRVRAGEQTPEGWSRDWELLGGAGETVRHGHRFARRFVEKMRKVPVLYTTWAFGEEHGRTFGWRVAVNVALDCEGIFFADACTPRSALKGLQGKDASLWEEASRLLKEELALPEEARDMSACPSRVFLSEEITIVVVRDKE